MREKREGRQRAEYLQQSGGSREGERRARGDGLEAICEREGPKGANGELQSSCLSQVPAQPSPAEESKPRPLRVVHLIRLTRLACLRWRYSSSTPDLQIPEHWRLAGTGIDRACADCDFVLTRREADL